MKHKSFTALALSAVLQFILTLLSAAPLPPNGSSSWSPSYLGMGISFVNAPDAGDPFTQVNGTVSDPEPLLELGFKGSIKGLRATVTPFYSAGFTITENDREYTPAILKVQIGSQYRIIAPQRESRKLVCLAYGDSNAKPGTGSWVPSYLGMGIGFVDPPAAGASFTRVTGTVTDAELLKGIGFEGAEEGQAIVLLKEVPLYLNGEARSLVRIISGDFYEVFVVEEGGRLVPVREYW